MAKRAETTVAPQVMVDGEKQPLGEAMERLLARGVSTSVRLLGKPGAGRRTALAMMADAFAAHGSTHLTAEPFPTLSLEHAGIELAILAAPAGADEEPDGPAWVMAPWGPDEWIEYLLARHHDQCGAVMKRLRYDDSATLLGGLPILWVPVLDLMANSECVFTVRSALRMIATDLAKDEEEQSALTRLAVHPGVRKKAMRTWREPCSTGSTGKGLTSAGRTCAAPTCGRPTSPEPTSTWWTCAGRCTRCCRRSTSGTVARSCSRSRFGGTRSVGSTITGLAIAVRRAWTA